MAEAENSDSNVEEESVSSQDLIVEDRDEQIEEMSLEARMEDLKKKRNNVFLFLGVAVLLFSFSLFPMPFSAEYNTLSGSASQGPMLVWGVPLPGTDVTDVPVHVTVDVENSPPSHQELVGYLIKSNDCNAIIGDDYDEAELGESSTKAYSSSLGPVNGGESHTLKFRIDPGQYCLKVQFLDSDRSLPENRETTSVDIKGKMWSNQAFGGLFGLICLTLSIFAFIGAQKQGEYVKKMQMPKESVESQVLDSVSQSKLLAGPGGPPSAGPRSGPAGPSSGPDSSPSSGPSAPPKSESQPDSEGPASESSESDSSETYEDAGNGYFFKKLPDGNYDQTVYVKTEEGTYIPHVE